MLKQAPAAQPQVRDFLERNYAAQVARRGVLVDVLRKPALVAVDGDTVTGVLTYDIVSEACEVLTLHVSRQWAGVGTRLVRRAAGIAAAAGCVRYWVVTTNDNVDALRFYQRRGFRLAAVRCGAVDEARRRLKPRIPLVGKHLRAAIVGARPPRRLNATAPSTLY